MHALRSLTAALRSSLLPRVSPLFVARPAVAATARSYSALRLGQSTQQQHAVWSSHSHPRGFATNIHGGYNAGQRATTPRNMSLKEEAIPVNGQMAITADNVTINIDGVLYIQIVDPVLASYGISDIYYAISQLAQTTMRSELGKISLDKTFAGREHLNADIVKSINAASEAWGVRCLRYEIRDISPPPGVKHAMDMQAEAERKKRATVLDSEAAQQSEINIAKGARQAAILQAEGEAAAIVARARATAQGIELLAAALNKPGGQEAVSLGVAEKYVEAFSKIAKAGNTMLIPSNPGDPAAMVAQALGIYRNINQQAAIGGQQGAAAAASSTDPSSLSTYDDSDESNTDLLDEAERQVDAEEQKQREQYEKQIREYRQ